MAPDARRRRSRFAGAMPSANLPNSFETRRALRPDHLARSTRGVARLFVKEFDEIAALQMPRLPEMSHGADHLTSKRALVDRRERRSVRRGARSSRLFAAASGREALPLLGGMLADAPKRPGGRRWQRAAAERPAAHVGGGELEDPLHLARCTGTRARVRIGQPVMRTVIGSGRHPGAHAERGGYALRFASLSGSTEGTEMRPRFGSADGSASVSRIVASDRRARCW